MWISDEKPSAFLRKLVPWETALKQSGLPVFLYGTGDGADKTMDYLLSQDVRISGVFVSDEFLRGQSFRGYHVLSAAEAAKRGRMAVILCFGLQGRDVFEALDRLAEKHLVIVPSCSVCGRDFRNMDALIGSSGTLDRIDAWLADDLSRELFRKVLRWKVTGDHRWLETDAGSDRCPEAYYAHGRTHIDVGAYDGDTVVSYLEANPSVERIMAFEPDDGNYRKLAAKAEPGRVDCYHAACADRNGSAGFRGKRGRGSAARGSEGNTVPVWKLDTFTGHARLGEKGIDIGSMKIDAEGMDKEVLFGAANLITDCRPVIRIAAYHKEEDFTEIPLTLKRLIYRSDLYFRKKLYVPAWDTEYILVPS